MALSDRDRRQLFQIQAGLMADSPRMARRIARHGGRLGFVLRRLPDLPRGGGRALVAVAVTLVCGLAMLVPGQLITIVPLEIIGACVTTVGPLLMWLALTHRRPAPRVPVPPARAL